jgi:hypothetical protein
MMVEEILFIRIRIPPKIVLTYTIKNGKVGRGIFLFAKTKAKNSRMLISKTSKEFSKVKGFFF